LSHYPYQCTIPIEGMSCANCARRVENAFHESDQYYAKVNLKKKQVTVHMKEDTPRKELENIITRAGYAPGSAKSITEP
ncbi:MAG: heavy-metal-associated domain-containing protein, partial [Lachnospiraceae bacterium]|nr:heavy-metal-associated domain-containing protein [Lachnospiraceae bacterium]